MLSSKTKTGSSETLPNKTSPATTRVSKVAKTPAKSSSNSPSSLQNTRLSIDRSPRSVDSKSSAERRTPKISTPPDKLQRPFKSSELQAQLGLAQEDLKKAKEQLVAVEKEKARAVEELKEAKRLVDEVNEKLSDALVAQKRAEESSEIEKFRADELEQAAIEAAQKKEEEWQKELEAVQNKHAIDIAAILSAKQELERVKHELAVTSEAKNTALSHADDATKKAEINAEKVEFLSAEVNRLKGLQDSKLEAKSNETAEIVKNLNSKIDFLREELERAKIAEEKLSEREAVIEGLKTQVISAKRAVSDADNLVDELKKKVELLEMQIEEATQYEKSASESHALLIKQLEGNNSSLQEAKSEISSLRENVESLEISVGRHKVDLEESDRRLEMVKQEAKEMAKAAESLTSQLESMKEEKTQAVSNEMLALSSVQSLTEEKNKLINELAASRDEEEKSKNAMETIATALHEVSMEGRDAKEKLATNEAEIGNAEAKIEDLKLVLNATKEKYEAKLDEMKEEMSHLEKLLEESEDEIKNSKAKLDEKELDFANAIKKSEEQFDALEREMDLQAENSKAEWHNKELGFISAIKKSEEEINALRAEIDRLVNLLSEAEVAAQVAREEGEQLRNTLKLAQYGAGSAKEAAEKAKEDSLQLKGKLLDKENELQCITQENDDLRTREAAALVKIEELSKLLAEATENKMEDDGELSNSEKSYDLLPKMEEFVENRKESYEERSIVQLPLEQIEKHQEGDLSKNANVVEQIGENGKANMKEREEKEDDDCVKVEVKMWDNCKIAVDSSPEAEPGPESHEGESDSKIDRDSFDQINGLSSETIDNGGSSPLRQQHKKKPLLRKFGSLLKKKSNPK